MKTIRDHFEDEGVSAEIISAIEGVDIDSPWNATMKAATVIGSARDASIGEERRRIDSAIFAWETKARDLRHPKTSEALKARLRSEIERARADLTAALLAAGAPPR